MCNILQYTRVPPTGWGNSGAGPLHSTADGVQQGADGDEGVAVAGLAEGAEAELGRGGAAGVPLGRLRQDPTSQKMTDTPPSPSHAPRRGGIFSGPKPTHVFETPPPPG